MRCVFDQLLERFGRAVGCPTATAAVAVAVWLIPWTARGDLTFTRIADTSTPAPDSTGTFLGFVQDSAFLFTPAIDGSNVAFGAQTGANRYGLYLWHNGQISTVIDANTPVPGTTGTFQGFGDPHISGGTVAFKGTGGLYLSTNGVLQRIVDSNTPAPGQGQRFGGFTNPVISGSDVFFQGFGGGPLKFEGIYRYSNGTVSVVADNNTPVPGSSTHFTGINTLIAAGGGKVAFTWAQFVGSGWEGGVYVWGGGSLTAVATLFGPAPGPPNTFTSIDNLVVAEDGTTTLFKAGDNGLVGLFAASGGTVRSIILQGQPLPGGGQFDSSSFWAASVSGDHVAFWDGPAIYSDLTGSMQRIVGAGDRLFGKTVSATVLDDEALSGDHLVFAVSFTDGTSGIYMVPEPASVGLLMVSLPFTLRRRRCTRGRRVCLPSPGDTHPC